MTTSINYFKKFPSVTYNGKSTVNITRRTKILEQLYSSPINFLSYTVLEGERPEDIARFYYEDMGKTWLVFLANNIVDPASEWPLSDYDFKNMLTAKYKTQAGTTDVITWTLNRSITANIVYYENADGVRITKDTYTLNNDLNLIDVNDWNAIRVYDYELELNENKRNIFLFNRAYATQAEAELKELVNGWNYTNTGWSIPVSKCIS